MINSVSETYYIDHPKPIKYSYLPRIMGKPIPRKYPSLACHYSDTVEIYNFSKREIVRFSLNLPNSKHLTYSSLYLYISSGNEIHVYNLNDYMFLFKIVTSDASIDYLDSDVDWLYINDKKYSIDYSWDLEIGSEVEAVNSADKAVKDTMSDNDYKIKVSDDKIVIKNITKINFNNSPLILLPTKHINYIENVQVEYVKNDTEPRYATQNIDKTEKIRETLKLFN